MKRSSVLFSYFEKEISSAPIECFRRLFGIILTLFFIIDWLNGVLFYKYIQPQYHFNVLPLSWHMIAPNKEVLWLMYLSMTVAAFCMVWPWKFFRYFQILFLLTFTYLENLDLAFFNNHTYLYAWLSFMFMFRRPLPLDSSHPLWFQASFKALLLIVFAYGAINKLQSDWISGAIGEVYTDHFIKRGLIPELFRDIGFSRVFTYGGIIMDGLVMPALFWRRSRILAMFLITSFHLSNAYLFEIGPFPWTMIGSLVLFAEPQHFLECLKKIGVVSEQPKESNPVVKNTSVVLRLTMVAIIFFHTVIPARRWIFNLPGPTTWTTEGMIFSWFMMGHAKYLRSLIIYVEDRKTGRRLEEPPLKRLSQKQAFSFGIFPRMSIEYAHFLAEKYKAEHQFKDPAVFMEIRISYNGRPEQYLLDPKRNLLEIDWQDTDPSKYLLPLEGL